MTYEMVPVTPILAQDMKTGVGGESVLICRAIHLAEISYVRVLLGA